MQKSRPCALTNAWGDEEEQCGALCDWSAAVSLQGQRAARCFLHPELPKRGGSDEHPHPAQQPALQPARQPQDFCLPLHAAHLLHQLLLQVGTPLPQGAAGAAQANVQEGPGTFTRNRRNRYLAGTQHFTQRLCPSISSLYVGNWDVGSRRWSFGLFHNECAALSVCSQLLHDDHFDV